MKLRSYGLVIISIVLLLGSCFTATAMSVTDGTGDIWHYAQSLTGTGWSWQRNVGGKPNIDITEISYAVNDNKITLSMKVSGTIQTSDKIVYWVWYNSTDATYWLSYSNGTGIGWGMKKDGMNFSTEQNVTISGNTLSVVLDALGDTSKIDLWGWAAEYTDQNFKTMNEWWGDWAPDDKFTYDTGSGDTDDTDDTNDTSGDNKPDSKKGTPGFELIFVFTAIAIALLLLRKRR